MIERLIVFDVKWDIEDGIDIDENFQATVPFEDDVDFDDEESVSDYLSDWLSDTYGYCHYGFDYNFID